MAKANFELNDVINWETKITKHVCHNISRIKGNQAMKYGQLLDYNMRNIFLETSKTKCGGETSPRPFFQKCTYLWINSLKFNTVCCNCMSKLKTSKNKLKLRCSPLEFTSIKASLKDNKRLGTSHAGSFSA